MRVSGLSAAPGSWPLADDTFALLQVTTDTSQPRWSLIDFISHMEGGRGGVQASPAALCVTSTCLEEVALLSQVDDDNNNINNTSGQQESFPTCQTFHRRHSSPDPVRGVLARPMVQSGSWGSNPRAGASVPSAGAGLPTESTFTATCKGGPIKTPILQMRRLRLL